MTPHIPNLDGRTFTCPDCAWRAVLATDGRIFQTSPGEPGHDHIGQAIAQRAAMRAEVERVCAHLQQQYARNRLEIKQYQKLLKYVIAEYMP